MTLPHNSKRIAANPATDEFRGRFAASIVNDYDFKCGGVRLERQRPQTFIEWSPVVVDRYDNAEKRSGGRDLVLLTMLHLLQSTLR
jgi:hypothetical protein